MGEWRGEKALARKSTAEEKLSRAPAEKAGRFANARVASGFLSLAARIDVDVVVAVDVGVGLLGARRPAGEGETRGEGGGGKVFSNSCSRRRRRVN